MAKKKRKAFPIIMVEEWPSSRPRKRKVEELPGPFDLPDRHRIAFAHIERPHAVGTYHVGVSISYDDIPHMVAFLSEIYSAYMAEADELMRSLKLDHEKEGDTDE